MAGPVLGELGGWVVFSCGRGRVTAERGVMPLGRVGPEGPAGKTGGGYSGLLTGKYTDPSQLPEGDVRRVTPHWDYFQAGAMDAWLDRVARIRGILTCDGRTLAQGALAWLRARSPVIVPLPGFRRTEAQVRENVAATERGPLTPEQTSEIDRLLAR